MTLLARMDRPMITHGETIFLVVFPSSSCCTALDRKNWQEKKGRSTPNDSKRYAMMIQTRNMFLQTYGGRRSCSPNEARKPFERVLIFPRSVPELGYLG